MQIAVAAFEANDLFAPRKTKMPTWNTQNSYIYQ